MSLRNEAKHSIIVANNRLGGAKITRVQRKQICRDFIAWCFSNGHIIKSMKDATPTMVSEYIYSLRNRNIGVATMHNRLASIRRAMRALGNEPDNCGITAKAVGLSSRNRSGTKVPISDEKLAVAIAEAIAMGEIGFAFVLKLERLLGVRGLESIMSVSALERFAVEANELIGIELRITKGTKGGKDRVTDIIHARAQETLTAIREALIYAHQNGGYLIDGGKGGLKSARSKYHRLARAVGLVGIYAPHSLRYAYAVEKILELKAGGYSRSEALSLVAKFLGHGPTRARYVSQVYGRSVVHLLPPEKRKSRIGRAIAALNKLMDLDRHNDGPSDAREI